MYYLCITHYYITTVITIVIDGLFGLAVRLMQIFSKNERLYLTFPFVIHFDYIRNLHSYASPIELLLTENVTLQFLNELYKKHIQMMRYIMFVIVINPLRLLKDRDIKKRRKK